MSELFDSLIDEKLLAEDGARRRLNLTPEKGQELRDLWGMPVELGMLEQVVNAIREEIALVAARLAKRRERRLRYRRKCKKRERQNRKQRGRR
jgi:hypothetical protein